MIAEFVIVFLAIAGLFYLRNEAMNSTYDPEPPPRRDEVYCEECLYNDWRYEAMEYVQGDAGDRHHERLLKGWFCPKCKTFEEVGFD